METIAVYWEERVRIYGTTTHCDLVFIQFECITLGQDGGGWLSGLGSFADRFYLYNGQQHNDGLCVSLVVSLECGDRVYDYLAQCEKKSLVSGIKKCKAEMLSFHGPHFQDRYGIAHNAMQTLAEHEVPVLATGCTGTTIHLLFSPGMVETAASCLAQNFYVPRPEDQ